jgi:antitoxin component YwqK of YwqJK toxin-antitoxin module
MYPKWLDRARVEEEVSGVEFTALEYDPDTGQYCLDGAPFTGVCKTWGRDGSLQSLAHVQNGLAAGVSVAWHPNGQIRLYSEMSNDVYHGWHIEWDEDGTKRVEQYYQRGRLVSKPTG